MPTAEELLEQIDKLINGEEQDDVLEPGQIVEFIDEDGNQQVAAVESVAGTIVTVRIQAVAGDSLEPTDQVRDVQIDDLTPRDEGTNSSNNSDDDDDEGEERNKSVPVETGHYVTWPSIEGETIGRVVSVSEESVTIPENEEKHQAQKDDPVCLIEVLGQIEGKYEPTGVHVAHKQSDLDIIDPVNETQRKLFMTLKNVEAKLEHTDEEESKEFGYIEGLASSFGDVDLGGDTVVKGAYSQTVNHNKGKFILTFDHSMDVSDLAGVTEASETEKGLEIKGKMPLHIESVKNRFEMVRFMAANDKPLGLSIGYNPVKTEPGPNGTRRLKEIALHEIAITPFPMDLNARISNAKARKKAYNAKRSKWQKIDKKNNKGEASGDTHNGDEGAFFKALNADLHNDIKELKQSDNV